MDLRISDPNLIRILKERVDSVAREREREKVAAFDADGTLWEDDVGESFFQYLIDRELVALPEDPWGHYENLKKTISPPTGYLWLAQIFANQTIETVRGWARDFVKHKPPRIFEFQRVLVQYLYELKFKVFVISASVKWAVEPGAALLNIPMDCVLGVQTKIVDGKVGRDSEGPITWREGKRQALLNATQGRGASLAFGNTLGDLDLLNTASHTRVAVQLAKKHSHMYGAEVDLLRAAQGPEWLRIVL